MQPSDLKGLDKRQIKAFERAHQREAAAKYTDQFIELVKNPMVELTLGALLMSYLYSPKATDSFFSGFAKGFQSSMFGASMTGIITAQQLSAALPYLTGSTAQGVIGGLLK